MFSKRRSSEEPGIKRERIVNVFKKNDKDNDGKLSKDEIMEAFKELGSPYALYRARRALEYAVGNNDSCVNIEGDDTDQFNKLIDYAARLTYN